jgi:hypothetical protein
LLVLAGRAWRESATQSGLSVPADTVPLMSNAAPWAVTAGNKFRELARSTENPTTKLLAEGLTALTEALQVRERRARGRCGEPGGYPQPIRVGPGGRFGGQRLCLRGPGGGGGTLTDPSPTPWPVAATDCARVFHRAFPTCTGVGPPPKQGDWPRATTTTRWRWRSALPLARHVCCSDCRGVVRRPSDRMCGVSMLCVRRRARSRLDGRRGLGRRRGCARSGIASAGGSSRHLKWTAQARQPQQPH